MLGHFRWDLKWPDTCVFWFWGLAISSHRHQGLVNLSLQYFKLSALNMVRKFLKLHEAQVTHGVVNCEVVYDVKCLNTQNFGTKK